MKITVFDTAGLVHAAIAEELAKRGVDTPYSVVSNPEFLKEGGAVDDFMRPDLFAAGATVTAYDPVAMQESRRIFAAEPRLRYAQKAMDALDGADALVIVTEWKEFRSADLDLIKQTLKSPVIIDGRNLYDPKFVRDQGITYLAVGR